ncbi:MAG: hypothetical protein GY941_09865 [Planctomycetes bacterium]|nr:hypothetical protein [Planctomycetota bacterium]
MSKHRTLADELRTEYRVSTANKAKYIDEYEGPIHSYYAGLVDGLFIAAQYIGIDLKEETGQ